MSTEDLPPISIRISVGRRAYAIVWLLITYLTLG